jgi:hypothetical protein
MEFLLYPGLVILVAFVFLNTRKLDIILGELKSVHTRLDELAAGVVAQDDVHETTEQPAGG